MKGIADPCLTVTDPLFMLVPSQIHLMLGVSIIRDSKSGGVTEINSAINIMDFFTQHILPELQDFNPTSRPVLKATSIKYVSVFRKQFSRDQIVQLFPLLIEHLGSSVIVVHTFAAYTIERLLVTKDDPVVGPDGFTVTQPARPKISNQDLQPFMESLFTKLFGIIDNTEWNENDHAMKCVTRSLAKLGGDVLPVTPIVLTKLTSALERIARNPRNPHFTHYLFESIAILIRSVCSVDANAVESFKQMLFPPFNVVLQMDIAELTPYLFQIFAQLLDYRPSVGGLGPAYTQLFPPLLTAGVWEKKGNIPALTGLLQVYIRKAPLEIQAHMNPILGIFQKLLASGSTEVSSFDILISSIVHFPQEEMASRLPVVFGLVLTKLQRAPTTRYKGLVTHFFAVLIGRYGSQVFFDQLTALQSDLPLKILSQVWMPRLRTDAPKDILRAKSQVIGLTKLLSDPPVRLLNGMDSQGHAIWAEILVNVVMLLSGSLNKLTSSDSASAAEDLMNEATFDSSQYDAQYSKLTSTGKQLEDPFKEVVDPSVAFAVGLKQTADAYPAVVPTLIVQAVTAANDPKLQSGLDAILQRANITL
jgi:exportin-2 (importin alpha re-exporter)